LTASVQLKKLFYTFQSSTLVNFVLSLWEIWPNHVLDILWHSSIHEYKRCCFSFKFTRTRRIWAIHNHNTK